MAKSHVALVALKTEVGSGTADVVFWGHISNDLTYKSLEGWFTEVRSWENEKNRETSNPVLNSDVTFPRTGIAKVIAPKD